MFGRASSAVVIDLLLNLLLCFVALFFLSFVMISDTETEIEMNTISENYFLITMRWETDNDVDLWVRLPDGRKIWYSNRDEPPAHLDLDVTSHRRWWDASEGDEYVAKINEEIVTIRDIFEGEYTVNAHYFSSLQVEEPVEVEIIVQDIKSRKIIYAGKKMVSLKQREVHFVRFTVESHYAYDMSSMSDVTGEYAKKKIHSVKEIYTNRPTSIVSPEDR